MNGTTLFVLTLAVQSTLVCGAALFAVRATLIDFPLPLSPSL